MDKFMFGMIHIYLCITKITKIANNIVGFIATAWHACKEHFVGFSVLVKPVIDFLNFNAPMFERLGTLVKIFTLNIFDCKESSI